MNGGLVPVHAHASVRVLGDDGEHRVVCTCRIASEDVNDDGTVTFPLSGRNV